MAPADYRTEVARRYVDGWIDAWQDRKQLSDEHANLLRREPRCNESATYAAARQPLPWIAVVVGLVPLPGSLAGPAQMVYLAP